MAAKKPTKKTTSTGSPTLDAANAAKKFKASKDYKPLTTAEKVAMAASIVGPGKVVKGAQALNKLAKGKKVVKVLTEPKSAVRVKPAAKTMGNPPNHAKAWEEHISSISRAGRLVRSAGKAKTKRVQGAKPTGKIVPNAKKPARKPNTSAEKTIVINSGKKTRIVKINPKPF